MSDFVLWKRLYPNDFNAINGLAAPGGGGGGARHIVLGTQTPANDVPAFIGSSLAPVVVQTQAGPNHPTSQLTFGTNPGRADEWRIADQVSHRHPALDPQAGFPPAYNSSDRPVVLVFRINGAFHVRHTTESVFGGLAPLLAARDRGVAPLPNTLSAAFGLNQPSALQGFEQQAASEPPEPFNPKDVEDGRKRTFAAILRRQGQADFRAALLQAYDSKCAVTGCSDVWVLEAAHITPYLGPQTNDVTNGILLRADIHTLFDLGLLGNDPGTGTVQISSKLQDAAYVGLSGSQINPGKQPPSNAALAEKFKEFDA